MAKVYELRCENGLMKAKIPENWALDIFANVKGEWRTANYKGGRKISQFIVAENIKQIMSAKSGVVAQDLTVYIWVGDKIDVITV